MDKGFRKFKQKQRISAIVRALLAGISLGVIVVAAFWLVAKLSTGPVDFLTWGLIGGGAALLITGILLAVLLPTDRRLAKRLDTKLELNEKVQTMIAFRNEDSEMIQLQRDDTQEILMHAPAKKMRSKSAWVFALMPVLACACLVGSILVKAQEPPAPPDPEQDAWSFRVYDEQKLKDLIEYVRTSKMDMEPKADVITELEQLMTKLKTIKKVGLKNDAVINTIGRITKIVSDFNTYDLITVAMNKAASEDVKQLGVAIDGLEMDPIVKQIEALKNSFVGQESGAVATLLADGILQALGSSNEDPENALYAALDAFAQELKAISNETTAEEIAAVLKRGEAGILAAVEQPRVNVKVEEYVVTRLITIFGIPTDKLPEDVQNQFGDSADGDPDKPEDPEKPGLSGGKGDGEFVVGSNDKIFDPILGEWVPYGQVYIRYQNIWSEYQKGEHGELDEEIRRILEDYMTTLTNSDYNK